MTYNDTTIYIDDKLWKKTTISSTIIILNVISVSYQLANNTLLDR